MSSYETHIGTLKNVKCDSIEKFLKDLLDFYKVRYDYTDSISDLLYIDSRIYDKYILINGTLYEWIKHRQVFDIEGIVQCNKNCDDTIDVIAQFYNGGTYLEEVLESDPIFNER